jgi:hypothetical protein
MNRPGHLTNDPVHALVAVDTGRLQSAHNSPIGTGTDQAQGGGQSRPGRGWSSTTKSATGGEGRLPGQRWGDRGDSNPRPSGPQSEWAVRIVPAV